MALFTAGVTIVIQLRVLRSTREQKASESIVQIVMTQGRDYYYALSGALKNFRLALDNFHASRESVEREHLLRRAFFFFGIFTYKENEFGFNHGFLYLGNLWGELAIRRIVDQISALLPVSPQNEAITHKCFSDMWRVHSDLAGPDSAQLFFLRTLYDLEHVLTKPFWRCTGAEQALRRAYDAMIPRFRDPTMLEQLRPLTSALGAILEYEFTSLFKDWYAGPKAKRQPPEDAPADFDEIVGGSPTWAEVRAIVSRGARR